ncbi:phytanoyl-CoA dioxygenase family protein [Bradyrhizobium sp. SRL28]|uniref:phytanoyl-CoA dioxygenase family protein n=1 Tax=Bradyrhizobium sp. SRL28 TaxID=2836178 RepID=UPI001BDEF1A9|nr:phytanoyl-CoA dioxygenase family protein [Bradyrhizobium sp. SRL28]MBT1517149.1 phytanoyl-CoA dioxygenase family protein [Bradyrhizobium sp. SRL28]
MAIDLARAKADYERDGYCIIPDVLSPSEVAEVRQRVVEQAEAEKALGWAREDAGPTQLKKVLEDQAGALRESVPEIQGGVNQRMYFLLNKGKVLRDLVTRPVALELAEHVLGENFLLSSFGANIAKKGGVPEPLHRDNWWCPMRFRKGDAHIKVGDRKRYSVEPDSAPKDIIMPACACNVVWMLTDFTEENGGTRLVPGSHLLPDNPDSTVPHKVPTIAATGKAGSCIFFDGRLWHGTGQNLTDEPRIGLLAFYCGPQFRQLENFFLGLDPAVLDECSDKFRDLLGYTPWFFYGVADGLSSRKRLRAREPWIPEMRIKGP